MGRLHILPQGYHWMELGHEERDIKIVGGVIGFIFAVGMLILAYILFY